MSAAVPTVAVPGGRGGGWWRRAAGPPVVLAAIGLLLLAAFLLPQPLAGLIGLPLALLLPGHTLLCALVGYEGIGETPLRLTLTVMVSLAVYPLLALTVHRLGFGDMSAGSVALSVSLVSLGASLVAWLRFPPRDARAESPPVPAGRQAVVAGVGMVGVAALVLWGAARLLPEPPVTRFVAIAFDGPTATVRGPVALPTDGPSTVSLRVRNHRPEPARFVLRAWVDGGPAWAPVGVRVGALDEWRGRVRGPVLPSGCLQRLRIAITDARGRPVGTRPLKLYYAPAEGQPCLYPAPFATGRR